MARVMLAQTRSIMEGEGMKVLPCIALALLMVGAAGYAKAGERITVCAHYAVQPYGYSKGYEVQATYTDGQELNSATETFNYSAYSKYVVIFWSEGQASVIQLDIPYLSAIPTTGTDQEGRQWRVAEMEQGNVCF
jgi:hypothetical protein